MLSCLYYSSAGESGSRGGGHACMHDMDTLDGGLEDYVV